MLLLVSVYLRFDVLLLQERAASICGRSLFGPELENSALPPCGVLNVPVIVPFDGSNSTDLTLPSSTVFWNWE